MNLPRVGLLIGFVWPLASALTEEPARLTLALTPLRSYFLGFRGFAPWEGLDGG